MILDHIYPAMFHGRVTRQIPSLADEEAKSVEFEDIDAEVIDPEDLEPRSTLSLTGSMGQIRIKSRKDS